MEEKELYLSPINGSVKVEIYRKRIKNVHLKVFRSLTVYLSVPEQVPTDWIDNFLNQRTKWIDDQITKYKKSSGYNNLSDAPPDNKGGYCRFWPLQGTHCLKNHILSGISLYPNYKYCMNSRRSR